MLIKVNADKHKFTIPFPLTLGFMFPGLATKFIKKEIMKDIDVSDEQVRFALKKMRKALKFSKKLLKSTPLVDVKSSDGSKVKIFL